MPMDAVWSDDFARIVGPLVSTIEKALDGADDLDGLKIVIYAEDDSDGPTWGFKFEGPPTSVNRAIDLLGTEAPIVPATH